ncbi:response regulator transcription factor [Auritidibacter ignavus]|uniref:response regulator transcription factor n=1 Tax=Auritidibacter ignavus TaxID=678932 RepID=UPI0024BADB7E|nr:response regulator transcription factor [Auritidibacter ignavus]WHS27579.1 response regulator transcription factor [Auritidibacter ignavus]
MTVARILVIEDEPRISDFVFNGLSAEGFDPVVAATGAKGLALVRTEEWDLIILDLGLPDMDGFEVLEQIRLRFSDLPVIILTARTSGAATVQGLTSGADDYVPKPFRFPELVARIRLRLRDRENREQVAGAPHDQPTASPHAGNTVHDAQGHDVVSHAEVVIDSTRHLVTVDGKPVDLSPREFALAELFFRNPGQALTRDVLLSRVWGEGFTGSSNVVDVYVRYLRNKLGADRFETVRGIGYRLVEEKHWHGRS